MVNNTIRLIEFIKQGLIEYLYLPIYPDPYKKEKFGFFVVYYCNYYYYQQFCYYFNSISSSFLTIRVGGWGRKESELNTIII